MFRRKRKYYLVLTSAEANLALLALLSFQNKVVARGIDAADVNGLTKKFT